MKFPRRMDARARNDFGVMQALKGFISRLGKASEVRIQRIKDQFTTLVDRIKGTGRSHPSLTDTGLDELQRETEEFYAVKNFVEKLPAGLTPPQYFRLSVELLTKLGRANTSMSLNKLYTFMYTARTKGKYYDVYPVITMTSVDSTFYKGFNFHWERAPEYVESVYRTYSFFGVRSKFYEIKPHELEYFLQIPTFMPIFIAQ